MTQIDHFTPASLFSPDSESATPDGLQSPFGRRRFIAGVGAVAGAAALASVIPAGLASASLPANASKFVALPKPERFADTAKPGQYIFTQLDANSFRVPVTGRHGVPEAATAIVATVTSENLNRIGGNFATIYPSGTPLPDASNLNSYQMYQMSANLSVVKLGAGGAVDFYRKFQDCRLILDVLGYYIPVSTAVAEGRFVPLTVPERVFDQRDLPGRPKLGDRQHMTIDVTRLVPPDASAVVVNLTVDQANGPSYYTVYPYADANGTPTGGNVPETSSLNTSERGEMRAVSVICAVSNIDNQRRINVYAAFGGHIIVDVFGYFTGPDSPIDTQGLFVPSAPIRIKNTRDEAGPAGRQWSEWILEVDVPSEAVQNGGAIVANVTMVDPLNFNFLRVSRARQPLLGDVSNVNAMRARIDVPNLSYSRITETSAGKGTIQVYTRFPSHVIVDYAGYFLGTPAAPSTSGRPLNPPPGPAPLPWGVVFNKPMTRAGGNVMPLTVDGDAVAVTDKGLLWHWQGTGMVGETSAHVAVFAHRTEAGAPLNRLHTLGPGDTWTVDTADGRRYTYAFAHREVTNADTNNILDATKRVSGNTFSFIACTIGTGGDPFLPTSTKYRIVVTGVEVGWAAIR